MVVDRDDEPILARVEPHGRDEDEVRAYEVALDLVNQVIGLYTTRIRDLERTEPVDEERIAALRDRQASYVRLRDLLRPGDREQVMRLRHECATIIRGIGSG